jgi:hypothetical protein
MSKPGPLVNIELSRRMAAVKVSNFYGSIIRDAEKEIERLHGLVAAEREACAKLCDEMESRAEGTECCKWPTPADCAYAIRARG